MVGFYSVAKGKEATLSILKAIGLAVMYADDFTITNTEFLIETSLDLSELSGVTTLGRLSGKLESVEGYDLPYVTKGAIVACAAESDEDVMADYDEYVSFPFSVTIPFELPDGTKSYKSANLYVGLANSSETDFYKPFQNVIKVILTPKNQ